MKYVLTNIPALDGEKTLYRIKALKSFSNVKKGDLGGYIMSENNLSHEGDCWVYDNAKVSGDAIVYDNAQIYGNSRVYGGAQVFGDTQIYGNSRVYGGAWVSDGAWAVSPFYLLLSKHSITSYNYTHLKIGCEIFTIDEWKERGEEIGRENDYTESDIAFYREGVLFAEKYIELAKKEASDG